MASKRRPSQSQLLLSRAARDKRILEARLAGGTFREIAEQFELSLGRIHQILVREQGAVIADTRELAGEYRASQLDRLEQIFARWMPRVLGAEAEATELQAVIKAMAHEAALTGALAASKTEIAGADGGAIKTQQSIDLSSLSVEELRVLEKVAKASASEDE